MRSPRAVPASWLGKYPGVYRLPVVGRTVTLIILRAVEPCPRNALWEIFSFEAAKVFAGADTYRWRRDDYVPILEQICQRYREVAIPMAYRLRGAVAEGSGSQSAPRRPATRTQQRGTCPAQRPAGAPDIRPALTSARVGGAEIGGGSTQCIGYGTPTARGWGLTPDGVCPINRGGTGHSPRPERLICGRPLIGTRGFGENVSDGANAPSGP